MTDAPKESNEEGFDRYLEHVNPDHECNATVGDECPYLSGMYFMVVKDPNDPAENSYLSRYHTHKMDPGRLIQAVVDFVDVMFQNNRGDAPAMVAHTRGRDLLRHAVESVPPPPQVSEELVSFMEENLEAWRGLTGE